MLEEHKLIGWLCFIRLQVDGTDDTPGFVLPQEIVDAFIERGWMHYAVCCEDECEELHGEITDLGTSIADLNSPEWGIAPYYSEIQ